VRPCGQQEPLRQGFHLGNPLKHGLLHISHAVTTRHFSAQKTENLPKRKIMKYESSQSAAPL
jgi:hypothetical protein